MKSQFRVCMALVGLFCITALSTPLLVHAGAAPTGPTDKPAAATSDKVEIESIYPTTVYPSAKHKRYDFDIVGRNFGDTPDKNTVEVIGKGPELMMEIKKCEAAKELQKYERPCLEIPEGMAGRKLSVLGFQPDPYKGPLKIRVTVKDKVKDKVSEAVPVTFAAYSQKTVFLMAVAAFAFLAWIIARLLWKGVGYYKIDGKIYGPLRSLFLDKQTDTYSLSKFQLLAWTSVAVFSYVYLFLCRVLIQWKFDWPDIPEGLPLLLGISVGTTVLSHGITISFGSKGSGAVHPSPADFISSGGMVVGERFQFFVWTIIGCLGFLFLLLRTDPATLTDLPKVPDNFLYLMGFSSAGYLGGKAVRKAGPVIKVISVFVKAADPVPPSTSSPGSILTINLKGENLDAKASIKVDGKLLRGDQFWIKPVQLPEPPTTLSTELDVSIKTWLIDEINKEILLEGEHTLTLINADGQSADVRFPIDPMIIDSVDKLPAGTEPVTIKVKGKNFGEKIEVEWLDTAGKRQDSKSTPPTAAKRKSATELEVALVPGLKGEKKGKLTLISETKLRASREVEVS